jgi:hypothetical protein
MRGDNDGDVGAAVDAASGRRRWSKSATAAGVSSSLVAPERPPPSGRSVFRQIKSKMKHFVPNLKVSFQRKKPVPIKAWLERNPPKPIYKKEEDGGRQQSKGHW